MTLRRHVEEMREIASSWASGTEGADRQELADAVTALVEAWELVDLHDWPWEVKGDGQPSHPDRVREG